MAHVVTAGCIDALDRSCVEVCPVDCIYQGGRKTYIQPDECIDCGACVDACPQGAIAFDDEVPSDQQQHTADNARFFDVALPGRSEPLGMPSGATELGPTHVDTPLVTNWPKGGTE